MVRATDGSNLSTWRQRFQRYSESGLTVVEFCSQEGVSTPSFYLWRKKVQRAKAPSAGGHGEVTRPSFQAVTVVGAAPVVSARLPGGLRLDIYVTDPKVVREILAELVRADQAVRRGESRC